jgi:hypothetical protein
MAVEIYSVVEYLESGEINQTIFDDEQDALKCIKEFDENKTNPFDVCGLDVLTIHTHKKVQAEVGYSLSVVPKIYNTLAVDDA